MKSLLNVVDTLRYSHLNTSFVFVSDPSVQWPRHAVNAPTLWILKAATGDPWSMRPVCKVVVPCAMFSNLTHNMPSSVHQSRERTSGRPADAKSHSAPLRASLHPAAQHHDPAWLLHMVSDLFP